MSTSKETIEEQRKLYETLLIKDEGRTIGAESKDPCSKESQMAIQCVENSRINKTINCVDYFQNYQNCQLFWVSL